MDPGTELSWTAPVCSRPVLSRPQLLVKLSSSAVHVWGAVRVQDGKTRLDVDRFVNARRAT